MKNIIKLLFTSIAFISINVCFSQNNLPSCVGAYDATTWTDCFGSRKLPSGDSYSGQYKNGKAYGFGTYTFADGHRYEGNYKMGIRDGAGKEYSRDGKLTINGVWENGTLINTAPSDVQTDNSKENSPTVVTENTNTTETKESTPKTETVVTENNKEGKETTSKKPQGEDVGGDCFNDTKNC